MKVGIPTFWRGSHFSGQEYLKVSLGDGVPGSHKRA